MGRIIVRKQKETKVPYEIPGLGKRVYSMEELVYQYNCNLLDLEEKIMDLGLCDWLEENMDQKELAEDLRQLIIQGCSMENFVGMLLERIPFCTVEEIQQTKERLAAWADKSPVERKRLRIERLMEKGDNQAAMIGIRSLLKETEDDRDMQAVLYHNLGVIAARGFYFEAAAEYFKRAFETGHREESEKMYMLALRFSLQKEEYVARIGREDLGERDAVALEEEILNILQEEKVSKNRIIYQQLVKDWEDKNQDICKESTNLLLGEWKERWRYS